MKLYVVMKPFRLYWLCIASTPKIARLAGCFLDPAVCRRVASSTDLQPSINFSRTTNRLTDEIVDQSEFLEEPRLTDLFQQLPESSGFPNEPVVGKSKESKHDVAVAVDH